MAILLVCYITQMIADPSKISIVTRAIKQFVNETAAELRRSGADVLTEPLLPLDETALKIAENVDKVGNSFEEGTKIVIQQYFDIVNNNNNNIFYGTVWYEQLRSYGIVASRMSGS